MTTLYRRRPIEVSAICWTGGNEAEVIDLVGRTNFQPLDGSGDEDLGATAAVLSVQHGGTWQLLNDGDWIVQHGQGWLRMHRRQFEAEYEPVAVPSAMRL